MNNAGTGNAEVGFWFFFWICLPIVLAFLSRITANIASCFETREVFVPQVPEVPEVRVVYEYKDRPKKQAKVKKPVDIPPPEGTSPFIISQGTSGLNGLGFSKKDAKGLVMSVCEGSVYTDVENLLNDCLSRLKSS